MNEVVRLRSTEALFQEGLLPPPAPVSYATEARELDAAYKTDVRLANSGALAIRAADALVRIHRYIESLGDIHPALKAELRHLEQTVSISTAELVYEYVRRPL